MGKFGFNPSKFWNESNLKYKTEEKQRTADAVIPHREKYKTAPLIPKDNFQRGNDYYTCTICKRTNKPETSQNDYMKQHLYIKCCVDKEKTQWRFQAQKISFRNYTPKAINQEMNMGMWM